jgi:hypothetical protein
MGAIIVINLAVITGFMAAIVYLLYSRPEAGEESETGEEPEAAEGAKSGKRVKTGESVTK